MPPKTPPPGEHPKPRIDLRGPKYPPALFLCPAVLIAQALVADDMEQLVTLTLFVFCAAVVTLNGSGFFAAPRGVDARPVFVLATALLGLMLGLRQGPAALWWAAAVLGALIVPIKHFLDRREARLKAEGRRAPKFLDKELEDRILFVELLARIAVEFARAEGAFTEKKRAAVLDLFTGKLGYEGARLGSIRLFINEELGRPQSLNALLKRFRWNCAYDSHLVLLELLFRVARASGSDSDAALALAREIGLALDLSPRVLRDIEEKSRESEADRARAKAERRERSERARREQEQAARRRREEEARRRRREQEDEARRRASQNAYEEARRRADEQAARATSREARAFAALGLAPGAKFAAVKKRYRRLIARHHPDKAAHLGEAARRAAEERSKELNAAYGYLKERYGG